MQDRLPLDRLRLRRERRRSRTSSPIRSSPISAYGKSKLVGEGETAANNPRHFIVRSSWLFGVNGRNFVDTMLGLGRTLEEVVVVKDQIGCPTYTGHLAEGLVRLLDWEDFGIYHMAGGGECSWYEFAVEIFEQAGVECRVLSQTSDMLDRPAPRPAYSVLVSEREPADPAARLARGPGRLPRRARGGTGMKAPRHRRRRLHRLQLRPPLPARASRGQRRRARQADLRGPHGVAPGPDDVRAHGVRPGRHRRSRRRSGRRWRAATRS